MSTVFEFEIVVGTKASDPNSSEHEASKIENEFDVYIILMGRCDVLIERSTICLLPPF
jgi:hypothetical protein